MIDDEVGSDLDDSTISETSDSVKAECHRFFLQTVKDYPIIYDLGHNDHKNIMKVRDAWKQIQATMLSKFAREVLELSKFGGCELNILQNKLRNLSNSASASKRKRPQSGSGTTFGMY